MTNGPDPIHPPAAVPPPQVSGDSGDALVGILGVATALSGAADLGSLLHLILRTCRQLTASDAGSIYLVERADGRPQAAPVVSPRSRKAPQPPGSGSPPPRTPAWSKGPGRRVMPPASRRRPWRSGS